MNFHQFEQVEIILYAQLIDIMDIFWICWIVNSVKMRASEHFHEGKYWKGRSAIIRTAIWKDLRRKYIRIQGKEMPIIKHLLKANRGVIELIKETPTPLTRCCASHQRNGSMEECNSPHLHHDGNNLAAQSVRIQSILDLLIKSTHSPFYEWMFLFSFLEFILLNYDGEWRIV